MTLNLQIAMYLFQIFMITFLSIGNCHMVIDVNNLNARTYFTSTSIPMLKNSTPEKFTRLKFDSLHFNIIITEDFPLHIVVQLRRSNVLNNDTKYYYTGNGKQIKIKQVDRVFDFVEGFVDPFRNASFVTGYLTNECFYGSVYLFSKVLFIEEVNNEVGSGKFNAVVHEYSNDVFQWGNTASVYSSDLNERGSGWKIKKNEVYTTFRSIIGKGKVCSLFVLIDNSFLRIIHRNHVKSAMTHILHTMDEVNSMFRSTDFDGDGIPDNIGFLVRYLYVIDEERSPSNFLPKYRQAPMDAKDYMVMFSRYDLLSEVCLGVVFTAQKFKNKTIGVSFTAVPPEDKNYFQFPLGGICDEPMPMFPRRSLNTLAISCVLENDQVLTQHIFELSVAHELGHSFGSLHDTSPECLGYLMTEYTPHDYNNQHFLFSPCSKKAIVNTIIHQGFCLQDYDHQYCGNGILEKGEECDCGTIRDCLSLDPCCTPRGQTQSCSLKKGFGYQCHPSQGLCCSSNCIYNDFSQYGLNCYNFQNSCPCTDGTLQCPCGLNGTCIENRCHSNECVRLNTTECECPASKNKTSCHTCCLHNDTCLDARILTKILTTTNSALLEDMYLSENTTTIFGYSEKFCNDFKSNCVLFEFRSVHKGRFCLLFGEVGICTAKYRCEVPEALRRYPRKYRRSLRSGCNIQISNTWCMLVVYKFLLFMIIYH